jgi:chromosome segregation ATPase
VQRGGFNGNRTVEVQVTNRLEGQGWAYRTGANSPSQQNVESSQQIYDLRTQNETFRIQNQDMQSLKDANETLLRKLASKDQLLQAMESQMSNLLTEKSSIGSLIRSQEKQMANLRDLISQKDREIHALATRFGENDQKNQMLLDKLKEFQQTQPSPTPGNLESTPKDSLNTNRDLEAPKAKPIKNFDTFNGNKTTLSLTLQDQKFLAAIVEEIKKKLIKMFGANYEQKFD